jgi:hypothetical protein
VVVAIVAAAWECGSAGHGYAPVVVVVIDAGGGGVGQRAIFVAVMISEAAEIEDVISFFFFSTLDQDPIVSGV